MHDIRTNLGGFAQLAALHARTKDLSFDKLKLLKEFIRLNKGRIVIVSNKALYECSASSETFRTLDHTFPGTCVNLEINTSDTANYSLKSERQHTAQP